MEDAALGRLECAAMSGGTSPEARVAANAAILAHCIECRRLEAEDDFERKVAELAAMQED